MVTMKRCNICVIPAYPLENVQLLKDRIVIPYVCYKHFGSSMTIVTQKNGEYPYLDKHGKNTDQCSENSTHGKLFHLLSRGRTDFQTPGGCI